MEFFKLFSKSSYIGYAFVVINRKLRVIAVL